VEVAIERGSVVFLDTAPLVYLIETRGSFHAPVRAFFERCIRQRVQLVTSLITYIEVLTQPERLDRNDLAARYRMFLTNSEHLSIHPLNFQVADECIRIRATYGFKTPDAIQLAVSRVCGAGLILSNDAEWKKYRDGKVVLVSDL
jgi:predicted nucleic acid-binding protein